ncbi:DNA repair protein RecO C-terminal domain-containing protein [Guyparkeria sp. 1SP6A2]|nr:DNA repair protein RecO C-terminal domain-containing protein [Guyparkeria sp. 1SP6A2]
MRGFLLHARPFQEHGLLLDWLTDDRGWVRMRQTGGRRVKKRGSSRPPNFVCLELLTAGRGGGWPILKGAEAVEPLRFLRGRRLAAAFYLHELILRALRPEEPVPGLFLDYWKSLAMLEEPDMPVSVIMRRFERRLLEHLGSGFEWIESLEDGSGNARLDPAGSYRLGREGGVIAGGGPGAVSGRVLQAIANDQLLDHPDEMRAARDLMQRLLAPHVGSAPFVSRRLWPSAPAAPSGHTGNASEPESP